MRYFFDTEFNEAVDPVQLISIGIVAEDGREFYGVNKDYNRESCNTWVKEHVLPWLFFDIPEAQKDKFVYSAPDLVKAVSKFTSGGMAEFWGYFSAYDWFLFIRSFGDFEMLPRHVYPFCYDIKQYAKHIGITRLPAALQPEHNALIDARWTRDAWEYLTKVNDKHIWPKP